jgi:hypothetical protein
MTRSKLLKLTPLDTLGELEHPGVVLSLVEKFRSNEAYYRSPNFDETSTRTTFIDPFFQALGWDMNDEARRGAHRDVLRERSITGFVAGIPALLRPDYTFRVGGQPVLCLEAKRPRATLDDPAAIYQVKNYAWNQGLSACVLTNFYELRAFTTLKQPDRALPWEGLIPELRLDYTQFETALEYLFGLLGYRSVRAGLLAARAEVLQASPARLGQRVDRRFLADLERWRIALAADIAHRTELADWQLTDVAQRMLDRLVFVRVCEDRGIEPQPLLRPLLDGANVQVHLNEALRPFDVRYNGSLFKSHLVDTVSFSDEILVDIIAALYPPRSPYRFDVINVEILGTIYERFLGSEVVRTSTGIKVEEKPEVRKAGGVYYTPQWVVEEIVHLVLDPLISGRPPRQMSQIRILDPACGSGSFLLSAFGRLIREYEAYYTAHPTVSPRDHYSDGAGRRRLHTRAKAQILVDNIYGIDVDPQAVEVTMMSLYLKVLEGESDASLRNEQLDLLKVAVLPPLDRNVVCGNTLVTAQGFQHSLVELDDDMQRRLNPFDWDDPRHGLGKVLEEGGFDAVIGNPPYFSVDATYGRHHPMMAYLSRTYPAVWQDKSDILFYFLARAVEVSKRYVGFIVSRAFLEAHKAEHLRGYLAQHAPMRDAIDFGGYQVFADASISTAIVVLDKSLPTGSATSIVRVLPDADLPLEAVVGSLREGTAPFETFEMPAPVGSAGWHLVDPETARLVELIDAHHPRLDGCARVGQGMQTGENEAFGALDLAQINALGIPSTLVRRRVRNSDIRRYSAHLRDEWLLYLEEVGTFKELPPAVQEYLSAGARKASLAGRAAFRRGNCEWWKYTWPLHKAEYGKPRLVCPYRAGYNRFALDPGFTFLTLTDTTVVFPLSGTSDDAYYLLALLNSRVLSYRYSKLGKLTGPEMYEYFWNGLARLPIAGTAPTDGGGLALRAQIIESARVLEALQHKLDVPALTGIDRLRTERQMRAADLELEDLVLDLYAISTPDDRDLIRELPLE